MAKSMRKEFKRRLKKNRAFSILERTARCSLKRAALSESIGIDAEVDYCLSADPSLSLPELKKDMLREYRRTGLLPEEYAAFQFAEKPRSERKTYISTEELFRVFLQTENDKLPVGKFARYNFFQPFYKRKLIRITFSGSPEEDREFSDFISGLERFILKPLRGTKGHGVRILSVQDVPSLDALKKVFKSTCVLEELIEQGEELKRFHPQSINTLRLASGMNPQGEFHPVFSLFRSGRGASVVDNVGSGGIIAQVDINTGIIVSDGLWKHRFFEEHPDTKIRYKGTQIPAWDSLLRLAEEAHRTIPEQKLIGWDFAWSTKGWVVVEVNPAPSFASYQTLSGKGIAPLLKQYGLL